MTIAPRLEWARVIVFVDAPDLRQPYTYAVPESLDRETPLATGDRVVVPFGNRPVLGIVVERIAQGADDIPSERVKQVVGRVRGPESKVPRILVDLAHYLAQTCLCSLTSALRTVLPETHESRLERHWIRQSSGQESKGERDDPSAALLAWIESAGPAGVTDARMAKCGLPDWERQRDRLRRRGEIGVEWQLMSPKVKARRVRRAVLTLDWERAQTEAERRRGKTPAQARILDTLSALGGGSIPVADLLRTSGTTASSLDRLVDDGCVRVETVEERRRPYGSALAPTPIPDLMSEQADAVQRIGETLDSAQHRIHMLHGVTGSGKTEVYLRSIAHVRRKGRRTLVLVPEIALTAQVVDQFRSRIGDRVAVLHSGLSEGERRDEWERIGAGDADVVVGARSAVFAPLSNIGLIIVDEEHESSYKQDSPAPRYHARDVAIERGRRDGAAVVLGSATPSVESYHFARQGTYDLIRMEQRAMARPLPTVEVVDLRRVWKEQGPCLFSPELVHGIDEVLAHGNQAILFLNRRGFAMFLLCRDCGFSTRCPHCEVSLTFHKIGTRLECHHCGYGAPAPDVCPSCGGERIRPFGIGTERVEEELAQRFPSARLLRMDRDTTSRKDAHLGMVRAFRNREADILIGTQMVAKGLDFPSVSLVGVVSADTALNIPDFRASERAFQLLTQVAGRAGRGEVPGKVIVQTFNPEHESVVAAASQDYVAFFDREIVFREELSYPPFRNLANVVATDDDPGAADLRLRKLADALGQDPTWDLLGPAACPLSRLRNKHRHHLLVKCADPAAMRLRLSSALGTLNASDRVGLTVDIDPMSLL